MKTYTVYKIQNKYTPGEKQVELINQETGRALDKKCLEGF